jgi:ornithine carbamoyltransferase
MPGLLTLDELTGDQQLMLADRSVELHRDRTRHSRPLAGRIVATMFLLTSTRTRAAFSTAALRLGAELVSFGPHDLQIDTGETIADTGRVLASMVDLLVVRSKATIHELRELSHNGALPVVNAMSSEEHPTQGLNDLAVLRLHCGDLTGLRFLYIGEGNNTAAALAKALRHIRRCHATFCTPSGYGLDAALMKRCGDIATASGGTITQVSSLDELPSDVDVLYTTRWETTGTVKPEESWREVFRPLYIDEALMKRWPSALVMHDLPAHRGQEISSAVLDGSQSIAWKQAEMKMPSAMAVLEYAAASVA